MENRMRKKILEGRPVLGTFFESGSANMAECIALGGFDFMIIDSEHGPFETESAADFIRAALLRNLTPLVRVKDGSRAAILKMLDIGAQGLIVPCINSPEEVLRLIEYAKYYPLGSRGFAFGRDAGWGFASHAQDGVPAYFATCNRETMLIPQCETRGCLDHIEEIAALDGVDGIFVGPYDLSVALGAPADFASPAFSAALSRILESCKQTKKPCFIYAPNRETAKLRLKEGYEGVALAMDTILFVDAVKGVIGELGC